MLDRLTTTIDQFADSVGLPAMSHLKFDFLFFTNIVLYKLRCGSKLYSTVVGHTKL